MGGRGLGPVDRVMDNSRISTSTLVMSNSLRMSRHLNATVLASSPGRDLDFHPNPKNDGGGVVSDFADVSLVHYNQS